MVLVSMLSFLCITSYIPRTESGSTIHHYRLHYMQLATYAIYTDGFRLIVNLLLSLEFEVCCSTGQIARLNNAQIA